MEHKEGVRSSSLVVVVVVITSEEEDEEGDEEASNKTSCGRFEISDGSVYVVVA